MSILLTILLVIAFFGVMIFLHELGHFLCARACKVKVLELALGMGPKLLSHRSKKTGTVYSLRLLPIGGFCSMLGENDEVDDPGAFCRHPAWQRFLILFSGAFLNILSAFLVMFIFLTSNGYFISNRVSGFHSPSYAAGLAIGDLVTEISGTEVRNEDEMLDAVLSLGTNLCTLTIERDGETLELKDIALPMVQKNGAFYRSADFVLGGEGALDNEVTDFTLPSLSAGLLSGDEILKVNGKRISVFSDASWEISMSANEPCSLTVLRTYEDGSTEVLEIENIVFPVTSEMNLLLAEPDFFFEAQENGGLFSTLWRSVKECFSTIKLVYRSLIETIAGKFGTAAISGPIGSAEIISEAASYGFAAISQLFCIISLNLGLFNLLPLPALDGGRILFVLLEMIRRKPINQKYEALIHGIGMVLLVGLMIFVSVLDITRLLGG